MKKILAVIGLVSTDMTIKTIIFNKLMMCKIKLFNNTFGFVPYLNKDQLSVFNKELNLGMSLSTLIIINVFIIILMPIGYRYYVKNEYTNKYFEYTYIFILSGVICSFLDKVIFSGSLDYILVGKQIIDMKDIYLLMSIVFGVVFVLSDFKYKAGNKKQT